MVAARYDTFFFRYREPRPFLTGACRALAASGLSHRGYCRRHQLSYHALTYSSSLSDFLSARW